MTLNNSRAEYGNRQPLKQLTEVPLEQLPVLAQLTLYLRRNQVNDFLQLEQLKRLQLKLSVEIREATDLQPLEQLQETDATDTRLYVCQNEQFAVAGATAGTDTTNA